MEAFQHYYENNPAFVEFIENGLKQKVIGGRDFFDFLIMPIQRVPRYVLLLSELLKYTPPDQPDHEDLKSALAMMKESAERINQAMRDVENKIKALDIQDRVTGKLMNLQNPPRQFVKEGYMILSSREGKEKKRYLFLFHDLLLETKPKLRSIGMRAMKIGMRKLVGAGSSAADSNEANDLFDGKCNLIRTYELHDMKIIDFPNEKKFQVTINGSTVINLVFHATSKEQKTEWFHAFEVCIQETEKKRMSNRPLH
jgi:hypothetical protein